MSAFNATRLALVALLACLFVGCVADADTRDDCNAIEWPINLPGPSGQTSGTVCPAMVDQYGCDTFVDMTYADFVAFCRAETEGGDAYVTDDGTGTDCHVCL